MTNNQPPPSAADQTANAIVGFPDRNGQILMVRRPFRSALNAASPSPTSSENARDTSSRTITGFFMKSFRGDENNGNADAVSAHCMASRAIVQRTTNQALPAARRMITQASHHIEFPDAVD
ncbi:hypothetical protein KTF23_06880 [Burkholderia multivorans]|uniref:hypothetical protein n=1 Tax=Burkholderia multivorans TaxID=87883 RepID=UPI001C219AE5|nr:hypothetical protein [Burkholderia multivorans]MBU9689577.1 hypothetical protein [Burkholderia multivorans]